MERVRVTVKMTVSEALAVREALKQVRDQRLNWLNLQHTTDDEAQEAREMIGNLSNIIGQLS